MVPEFSISTNRTYEYFPVIESSQWYMDRRDPGLRLLTFTSVSLQVIQDPFTIFVFRLKIKTL